MYRGRVAAPSTGTVGMVRMWRCAEHRFEPVVASFRAYALTMHPAVQQVRRLADRAAFAGPGRRTDAQEHARETACGLAGGGLPVLRAYRGLLPDQVLFVPVGDPARLFEANARKHDGWDSDEADFDADLVYRVGMADRTGAFEDVLVLTEQDLLLAATVQPAADRAV
jgi:hypothetical protein